ncbi:hypothetical protein Dda_0055 [Drechslerella dactyloides]|uniref:Uncharacterized protein n=1 Tax=Drechslerella dactyloides TaxID=74499 RepID=A0AAD6NNX6_DREDA|nr:hypothetical protein Dda_0055 [Drechslerella dactyloides]
MSFPTESCFVSVCNGWDEGLLRHPANKFLHKFEASFAKGTMYSSAEPFGTWHTDDFTYTDELGNTTTGAEAFEKERETYKTFLSEFHHWPLYVIVKETTEGYDCFGHADLYGNYKVPGDKTVTDPEGKSWQFKSSGTWRITYRKDAKQPDGMKMSSMRLFVNALPLAAGAVKREMVPQDAMLLNAY